MEIRIRDEFIKLGQALKLADLVSDGVEAKYVINDGLVKVNGEVDTRRGRKVYGGDVISYNGQDVKVLSGNEKNGLYLIHKIKQFQKLRIAGTFF